MCIRDRGCIEKGKLLQQKGSNHHYSAIAISGIANIVDSLAAIDECVFKKHYLTMGELIDLLDTNFEGREDLRQLLINKAPKFGNNIEEVDKYAGWLIGFIDEMCIRDSCSRDLFETTPLRPFSQGRDWSLL